MKGVVDLIRDYSAYILLLNRVETRCVLHIKTGTLSPYPTSQCPTLKQKV